MSDIANGKMSFGFCKGKSDFFPAPFPIVLDEGILVMLVRHTPAKSVSFAIVIVVS
jgi:hypothetical protein